MLLSKWLAEEITVPPDFDCDIKGITQDSRRVYPQFVFISMTNDPEKAAEYEKDAILHGAVVIVREGEASLLKQANISYIFIPALTKKLSALAAKFYDYPAKELRIIGVTGTNGKTSCSQFIAQLLEKSGVRCAIIGTLGCGFYGALEETGFTTPDAVMLQGILRDFVDRGAVAVSMEVSSHSIHQGRIDGIEFEMGLFTNLTQDHLDYHGDMDTYAGVKYSFISGPKTKHVIINADDAHGREWIESLRQHKPVYAYTIQSSLFPEVPTGYLSAVALSANGVSADLHTPWGEGSFTAPVVGLFNVSNVLLAIMAVLAYGIPFEETLTAVKSLTAVPGRMQHVASKGQPLCVVDYAHTPDALDKALSALKGQARGRLICVFGCGGDRDQAKRPLMAKVSEKWADMVIVTSDNPRHEAPKAIVEQILSGFSHPDRVLVELDRSKAIKKGIQLASQDDCILVAGKGAEQYQQIGDQKIPFDDVNKIMEIFNAILVK